MAKQFQEIFDSEQYKNASDEERIAVRDDYFDKIIKPKVLERGEHDPSEVYNDFKETFSLEDTTPEPSSMSAQDVMGGAIKNFGPSARQYGEDIYTAVSDPINTAKSIYELGKSVVELAIPGEQGNEELARGVGKFFAERYGTLKNIKRTIANDPVGFLGDFSMLASGGGTLAAKIPGLTKASKFVSKALPGKLEITPESIAKFGSSVDPLSMAGKSIAGTARGVGNLTADLAGGVLSGSGATPLRTAFREGLEGGDTVLKSMRGTAVEAEEVVRKAHNQMKNLAQERLDLYRANKDKWTGMNNKIDFSETMSLWKNKRAKAETHRGFQRVWDATEKGKIEKLGKILKRFEKNKAIHDAEGFDVLKQTLYEVNINPAEHKVANKLRNELYDNIRNKIKDEIPEYAKAMDDYQQALNLEKQLEKTLSLGVNAPVDTTLRKLQSAMRDNVNAGLGHREKLLKELDKSGEIFDTLAGQALNPKTPRGIARLGAGLAGVGMQAGGMNPTLGAVMLAQSPRLTGEAARLAGKVGYIPHKIYKGAEALGKKIGLKDGIPYKQAGRTFFQTGRVKELEDEYRRMQMSKNYKKPMR
jgi:rubrerythrin